MALDRDVPHASHEVDLDWAGSHLHSVRWSMACEQNLVPIQLRYANVWVGSTLRNLRGVLHSHLNHVCVQVDVLGWRHGLQEEVLARVGGGGDP